jgi:cell division protein FtsQ
MPLLLDTRPASDAVHGAEQVDPRIRARRAQVALEQQHRRRRWVAIVLATATALIGAWFVTRTALLDVDQIRVVGSVHTTDDEIRAASGLEVGDPILDLDTGAVRSRLLALPWVADARVDRSWDGDVVVRVTERRPVAMLSDAQGQPMLVDADGMVVARADVPDPELVAVDGLVAGAPGEQVADSEGALAVVSALTPGLRTRVEKLVVAPDGQLRLQVRPSGVVDFCGPTDIAAKVRSLQTVFAQVDDTGLTTLSVCVPDQPTIGPRS